MEWIQAANQQWCAEKNKQKTIEDGADTVWDNVCRTIERAVSYYSNLETRPRNVAFSGRANHTVFVAIFPRKKASPVEVDRVTITFDSSRFVVEVKSIKARTPTLFPIGVNSAGQACLTYKDREISIEEFTKLALSDAFFPQPEWQAEIPQRSVGSYLQKPSDDDED